MERLTTNINGTIYFAKGKYPPTTLCAEMETWEVRECMERLAEYEDTEYEPQTIINLDNIARTQSNSIIKMGIRIEELDQKLQSYNDAEKQEILIDLSNAFTTEEVKDIFHSLMQSCYGVPIPKETTDYVVDDLMR